MNKVVRAFYLPCFGLATSRRQVALVGRPTCAPATIRLTPQLVGTSAITNNLSPYTCLCHICMGIIFCAYSIRSELRIQPNTN